MPGRLGAADEAIGDRDVARREQRRAVLRRGGRSAGRERPDREGSGGQRQRQGQKLATAHRVSLPGHRRAGGSVAALGRSSRIL
jgi:hypothetical protein